MPSRVPRKVSTSIFKTTRVAAMAGRSYTLHARRRVGPDFALSPRGHRAVIPITEDPRWRKNHAAKEVPMPQRSRRTQRFPRLTLLTLLALSAPVIAQERAGTLSGRITDPNGNPLPGARVHVEPRGLDATTNSQGRFALSGLPAGHATAEISCVGFASEKKEVDLAPGRGTSLDAQLQLDLSVSETVTVTTSRSRGEVEALNQQKSAPNLVNVLPAEIITSLPNTNVADAIGRLPSVSLERDEGEGKYVQIRGTEPRLWNFEINGRHIPSPHSAAAH